MSTSKGGTAVPQRKKTASKDSHPPATPLMAVIELGTTSIRMAIAQPRPGGKTGAQVLDTLQQTVSLGRDTFTTGCIGRKTTEDCVSAVQSFRRVMQEYGILQPSQIRAIASSAVREASNREEFLDRMMVATGIQVTVIEEAEVNRLTYRAVRPALDKLPFFRRSDTLVVEVGGGSTEALMFHRGKVTSSHMYRLGSLRLVKSVEEFAVSRRRELELMRDTIDQTVELIRLAITPAKPLVMLVLGAEMRFAAAILHPEWDHKSTVSVGTEELETLSHQIADMSAEEMVTRHHISYEDAETIRPTLMIYSRLAQVLRLKRFFVAEVSLRSGMLAEMDAGGNWTSEFKNQIISSALETAHRYQADITHARRVCAYAMELLTFLRDRHDFSTRDEMILSVAALLHEIGLFIRPSSHHKHAHYLIANSDVFGLGRQDVELAAMVARYHRRSTPKTTHGFYMQRSREDRLTVSKLAAILRVANALDFLKDRQSLPIRLRERDGVLTVMTDAFTNFPVIQRRVGARADLFEQVYGLRVAIRQKEKDTRT